MTAGWSSKEAREPHKLEVGRSNRSPATRFTGARARGAAAGVPPDCRSAADPFATNILIMSPGDYDEDGEMVWTPNIHGNSGSASPLSHATSGADAVQKLREVVAEVTRGRIPAPTKRRPGFF